MPTTHRAGRVINFLPLVLFVIALYGLRTYSEAGWGAGLALAGIAGAVCAGLVGSIIYQQYAPSPPCDDPVDKAP